MSKLFLDNNAKSFYVTWEYHENGENFQGVTHRNSMYISETNSCADLYFTMAHETIHFISDYFLEIDSSDHDIEIADEGLNVFCKDYDCRESYSIENWIFREIVKLAAEDWKC